MTSPIGKRGQLPKDGFTLLEVLTVLVLVGILLGLSLPRFSATTQDLRLINSARSLTKLLTYAQERAIVERVSYQAAFDATHGTYWLMRTQPDGAEVKTMRIQGRYGRVNTLPSGVAYTFPVEPIRFYPDGTSDAFSIELSVNEHRFILTQGIGHVRIQEEKG